MKKDFIQIAVFIVLIVLIITGQIIFNNTTPPGDKDVVVESACRLDLQKCDISVNNTVLTVSTAGDLQPLKPFIIKIKNPSSDIKNAVVDLSMIDMDMGKNQFVFEQLNPTEWQASVISPVCTTGRRDWRLDLTIKTADKRHMMSVLLQL